MGKWLNADGLYVKLGTDEGARTTGGMHRSPANGGDTVFEFEVLLTDLNTSTPTIVADNVVLPKNSQIISCEIINEVAATSGGSATLDVGLIRLDRSTEIDYNGIVAAAALSTFNSVGETNTIKFGSTGAGALMGALSDGTYPGLFVCQAGTAVFTAGRVTIRVVIRPNFLITNPTNTTSDTTTA